MSEAHLHPPPISCPDGAPRRFGRNQLVNRPDLLFTLGTTARPTRKPILTTPSQGQLSGTVSSGNPSLPICRQALPHRVHKPHCACIGSPTSCWQTCLPPFPYNSGSQFP